MDEEEPLDVLARWLIQERAALDISAQVIVHETGSAHGTRTVVEIDHRLSCPLEAHEGWRVSTKPTFLFREHFSSQARHYLKTAEPGRGRTIYCHEPSVGEVVAALSYHVDDNERMPVLLTTIGLRIDTDMNAFLGYRTLAGALVLKQYVHAVAEKIGRGGYVNFDLANPAHEALARKLGFRPAPKIKGFRTGGLHLRQPAAGD
jgi:hypothetical protein